jgi:hypothetical protein
MEGNSCTITAGAKSDRREEELASWPAGFETLSGVRGSAHGLGRRAGTFQRLFTFILPLCRPKCQSGHVRRQKAVTLTLRLQLYVALQIDQAPNSSLG